jgi:hypothetical protein
MVLALSYLLHNTMFIDFIPLYDRCGQYCECIAIVRVPDPCVDGGACVCSLLPSEKTIQLVNIVWVPCEFGQTVLASTAKLYGLVSESVFALHALQIYL